MHELPPSGSKAIVHEEDGLIVYVEPYFDSVVWVAETDRELVREYPDGVRSYTNKRSGEQTTYYPDNRYTFDIPGEPTIEGQTQFDTSQPYG